MAHRYVSYTYSNNAKKIVYICLSGALVNNVALWGMEVT